MFDPVFPMIWSCFCCCFWVSSLTLAPAVCQPNPCFFLLLLSSCHSLFSILFCFQFFNCCQGITNQAQNSFPSFQCAQQSECQVYSWLLLGCLFRPAAQTRQSCSCHTFSFVCLVGYLFILAPFESRGIL